MSNDEKTIKLSRKTAEADQTAEKEDQSSRFYRAADRLLPDVRLHPDREGGNAECEKECR
ncbi:hypothetical protein BVAD3_34060 [Bacillus velezensis]|nr:hypothetical protein BVAD3_34060 [Bacillus velezensis]